MSANRSSASVGQEAGPAQGLGINGESSGLRLDMTTAVKPASNGKSVTATFVSPASPTEAWRPSLTRVPLGLTNPAQSFVYYDGRTKNGVPAKLQHVDHGKNGNFSVMHMGVLNLDSSERLAAARRTSEGTAAASRLFNQTGYKSLRQLKQDGSAEDSQQPGSNPSVPRRTKLQPGPGYGQKATSPSPHETKTQQARLLTLLRSLNPVTVVDQLCKGLAYFGGIPGAPPPADDSAFPQSSAANGSGSFFVGWLAEIFPSVDASPTATAAIIAPEVASSVSINTSNNAPSAPASATPSFSASTVPVPSVSTAPVEVSSTNEAAVVAAKRKRGRPKGSKSSKVRADKGKRHVSKALKYSVPLIVPTEGEEVELDNGDRVETQAAASLLPDSRVAPLNTLTNTPVPRKRGRPKGSKNRPKTAATVDANQTALDGNEATPAQIQPVSTSIAVGTESLPLTNGTSARAQLDGVNPGELPTELRSYQPGIPLQQSPPTKTAKSAPNKRKTTQQDQISTSRSNTNVSGLSRESHPTKRRHISKESDLNISLASRPEPIGNNFGPQPQAVATGIEDMTLGTHSPQTSQLGQYYLTNSPQQRHSGSPNPIQAIPGRQADHSFASHHMNANYYTQQGMQQASHHISSISASSGGFNQRIGGSTNAHLSPNRPEHAAGQQQAIPQAQERNKGSQNHQQRQSAARPSANMNMGSYPRFNSSGFL
jgi:hypothetical protein